ncbi:MAG: type I-C CRISPR-associated protein Cas5c [Proteobacteria bacterium]|nr:type I-C CRISPR-associated protein Cas5c [Pseudomonadota bacterium]
MKKKFVYLKVWGDWACFTRPEMKVERVSYSVITPSAARGVLEAIFWEPQLYYTISSVTVLKKGHWSSVRRNEVIKKISTSRVKHWQKNPKDIDYIKAGGGADDATQRNMLALRDVAYIIGAEINTTDLAHRPGDTVEKYAGEFNRRASLGKCYHRPGLGMREFACDFELAQDATAELPSHPIDEQLGIMLYDVFSPKERHRGFMRKQSGKKKKLGHIIIPKPCYFQAKIENSVIKCHPQEIDIIYPNYPKTS